MISIRNDILVVPGETSRLEAFRLEDTARAPVVIVFVDQEEPQLVPLATGGDRPVPTEVRSDNQSAAIQVIGYEEIQSTLAARS